MGSIVACVSEKCDKFKKLFVKPNRFDDDFSNEKLIGKKQLYESPNFFGGYISHVKDKRTELKNHPKKILTSNNFKEFMSSNTKFPIGRTSNLTEFSNYSKFGDKLTNLSNINNISINSRNKYFGQLGSAKEFNFTYPCDGFQRSQIFENKQKSKLDDFTIIKLLGKGTFGKVLLVKNKRDLKLYAMKILKKYKLFKTNQIFHTKTEREILEKINHPFIVKLFFAFQTAENLYLVTEFMQGGELFFHLKKARYFSEHKVRKYICEIILALEHLHNNKIIYRDLKPENILLDCDGHIKLADFGLSKFFNNNNSFSTVKDFQIRSSKFSENSDKAFTLCGTPEYIAPEILIGKGYDKNVDWWSLGVLTFEMLCGYSPFKRRKDRKLSLTYYSTPVEFSTENFISEEAKNLVMSFLRQDPDERLSNIKEIKSHPFFKSVNWDEVVNKKNSPDYIPKAYLKSDDDLRFFDKAFTESHLSEIEKNISNSKKFIPNDKNKKIYDEFENFSFVREDIEVTS